MVIQTCVETDIKSWNISSPTWTPGLTSKPAHNVHFRRWTHLPNVGSVRGGKLPCCTHLRFSGSQHMSLPIGGTNKYLLMPSPLELRCLPSRHFSVS